MIEKRMQSLEDSIKQLTIQMRELTDIYIGAAEAGELSGLIPAAVRIRNRRKDSNSEFREYSLLDAREIFMQFHRIFGEKVSEEWLKKFHIKTITDLNDVDLNRFVFETKGELMDAED